MNPSIEILDVSGLELPEGGDCVDWLEANPEMTLNDLLELPCRSEALEQLEGSNVASGEIIPPQFADDALALEFVGEHGRELQYVAAWGKWYVWNGSCWKLDETLKAFDLVRGLCRLSSMGCEKENIAKQVTSAKTIAAVEKLAKADRRTAATVKQWDADPWLLNTPGGVVNLRTGEIKKHQSTYFMTKITRVAPEGDCPLWKQFLREVTNGDEELIGYLRRKAGYCLTGITKEHDLDFFHGGGGNGKGTFLNTLTAIMGDYATVANIDTFTASNKEKHPTELAMFCGARLVTAQETEEGQRWSENRIKALTGGDPIAARFMRQDFFIYIPQFKLIIAGNHKPRLRNVDEAIRRRLHLVPFTVTISNPDKNLPEKLKAEWPGILQWAIDGAKEWATIGLNPPLSIRAATSEYLAAEDALENWRKECCVLGIAYTATITDLFENWKKWCERTAEYVGSMKRFSQSLRDKHPELVDWQCPTTRRTGFRGIQVIKETASHWSDTR